MARSKPVARAAVLLAFVVLVASCLGAAAGARRRNASSTTAASTTRRRTSARTSAPTCAGASKKKKCKFDDRCFYDPAANFCQDVGPNVCRGIQKRHGGKASVEAGGPGGKKKRCPAASVPVGSFANQCVCLKKNGTPAPLNKKGLPKKCRFCDVPSQE